MGTPSIRRSVNPSKKSGLMPSEEFIIKHKAFCTQIAMNKEFVIHNGVEVMKGWPEEIAAAQLQPTVLIGGLERRRLHYGDEDEDCEPNKRPCHDCCVLKGQFHVFGCDVERCPDCSGQMISCDCDIFE